MNFLTRACIIKLSDSARMKKTGPIPVNFFTVVINTKVLLANAFFFASHFQPNLIFMSKAGAHLVKLVLVQ
jgi:hypothetical protein